MQPTIFQTNSTNNFLTIWKKTIDVYHQTYHQFLLIGDFNVEDTEQCLLQFLFLYDAKKNVSEKTCFESKDNPGCIDLFINNSPNSFQNTTTTTGLSDFHKMVITVLKATFTKGKPKIITYNFIIPCLIKNKTIRANYAPCHKNYEKSNNEKERAAT